MNILNYNKNKILKSLIIEKYEDIIDLDSIIISSTSKTVISNNKNLYNLLIILQTISGQAPIITRAKKSIAAFKLRKNSAIGGKVTLRGDKMNEFLMKFINIILPKIKNIKNIRINNNSISIGIADLNVFPEIENKVDKLKYNYGITITIKTNRLNEYFMRALKLPIK